MVDTEAFLRESNAIEGVHDDNALADALEAWNYLTECESLNHERIKKAHELLLVNRQPNIAGRYRESQVRVGDRTPPAAARVPYEIDRLLGESPPTDALDALEWHVRFELVHPFPDGNGRVGRLLYLWHCRQLTIEPIMWRADDVDGYYALFEESRDYRE
jgi:Fic family protein